ncbi:MAG: hypothetical protein R3F65_16730 [bacterium]
MADETAPPQSSPETFSDSSETAPVSLAGGASDTGRQPVIDFDEDVPGDTAPLDVDALTALRALVDEETGTTQQPLGAADGLDELEEDRSNPDDTLTEGGRREE